MNYQVKVSFNRIVSVEAKNKEYAEDVAVENMLDEMGTANESLENELKVELVCGGCGISLMLDEEKEDSLCSQCFAVEK